MSFEQEHKKWTEVIKKFENNKIHSTGVERSRFFRSALPRFYRMSQKTVLLHFGENFSPKYNIFLFVIYNIFLFVSDFEANRLLSSSPYNFCFSTGGLNQAFPRSSEHT